MNMPAMMKKTFIAPAPAQGDSCRVSREMSIPAVFRGCMMGTWPVSRIKQIAAGRRPFLVYGSYQT
jgi:hypothetical protein